MRLKVGEDGDPGLLDELAQLLLATGLPGADPRHDHRPARLSEQLQGAHNGLMRRGGRRVDIHRFGDGHGSILDRRTQHVRGHVQQHRSGRARGGEADGLRDEPRYLLHGGDLVRPLGHGPGDADLVDAGLEGVGLGIAQRGGAADVQDGSTVQEGIGHGSDDVREARAGRHHCDAELAGGARITFGRVPGRHLVARVEHRNAVIEARLEDRLQMCAVQSKELSNARLLQGAHQQLAARHRVTHVRISNARPGGRFWHGRAHGVFCPP